MHCLRCLAGWLCLGLWTVLGVAMAHDVPPSRVMLDLGKSSIQVDMDVPLSELVLALDQPLPLQPEAWLQTQQMVLQRYLGFE